MNMNKELYLKRLRSLIRALPDGERRTIIDFYREIIEDKMESGQTEAEAVAELGDVHVLAQKILAENPNRKPHDANRIAGIVLASFFGVMIVAAVVVNALSVVNFRTYATSTQQQSVEQEAETAEGRKVSAPVTKIKCIYVDAENKDVEVIRGTGNDITMAYETDADQSFTFTTTDGVMKLVNRQRFKNDLFHFLSSANHGHIEVGVPEGYAGEIYLNSSNGMILVSDALQVNKLTCDTSNGTVRLNNIHAETVIVDTSNAQLDLTQVTASKVNASSSNGRITVKDLASPDVNLNTSNGSIKGNVVGAEQDYNIHTSTSNGNCSPSDHSGGTKDLTCDTSNGDIDLTFSE